ncbi:unnamed protein product [Dovyalis caffra]|uniref:Uncharacterized protein n=1 Tax=Dovyalis caffra TaxID=77055 RepID=A0AAV1RHH6_9ROSI|nr:unnamed protein product [Dovyalis caffra]
MGVAGSTHLTVIRCSAPFALEECIKGTRREIKMTTRTRRTLYGRGSSESISRAPERRQVDICDSIWLEKEVQVCVVDALQHAAGKINALIEGNMQLFWDL